MHKKVLKGGIKITLHKKSHTSGINSNIVIGIDGNEANEVRSDIGAPAGVNVYALELLRAINKLQDIVYGKYEVVVYLKNKPSSLLPKAHKYFKYSVLGGGGLWVLSKLTPRLIAEKRNGSAPNVFLSLSHYAPVFVPLPKAASIMDLGYHRNSAHLKRLDYWQLKYWTASTISLVDRLFSISDSVKNNIVRHYPGSKSKIVVTPLAYDGVVFNKNTKAKVLAKNKLFKAKHSIGQKYVLYLGVIKPSKNVEGLVTAWKQLCDEYPKISLVIGGKKSWGFKNVWDVVVRLGLQNKIIFTDYVKEEDKAALISGAYLFVLPSFWEGFGLDILNAMACGVPVAASNIAAIPEVAGKAGVLFDPENPEDIAKKISEVLDLDSDKYKELSKKSIEQASKFSWEKTAKKTIENLVNII